MMYTRSWMLLLIFPAMVVHAQQPKEVPAAVMENVYNEVRTPYKYGMVVVPTDNTKKLDCPSIFRKGRNWYMTYLVFDGRGYETWLSTSKDLLDWKTLGRIMSFSDTIDPATTPWDANQKAGYIGLQDHQWGGSYELQKFQHKYWLSYFGGKDKGYEAGSLAIGIGSTAKDPSTPHEWQRTVKPVLTSTDADVRWWENKKLFKSTVIWDKKKTTGYPFVMYYNANGDSSGNKPKWRWFERIGMAVSNDMVNWKRLGTDPVMGHPIGITGDAVIQKIGDVWVMFYFGAFWSIDGTISGERRKDAFNRFACSYDLINWTDWTGEDLIRPSEEYDARFAHKSFVVKHKGVVYHFYCAVNNKDQRGIAVATSIDKGKSKINFVSEEGEVPQLEKDFQHPPPAAKPWVMWYWMHGAISKKGITADLEAMKQVGIGGAYMAHIKDTTSAIPFQPTARQLTPEWWEMVRFALQEAKRLDLKLALHVSDGFALAGGPWITPELSMQKLVWTKEYVRGGRTVDITLEKPESKVDYYKDIAVYAYPVGPINAFSDTVLVPSITASNGSKPYYLNFHNNREESFKSDTGCWIQYKYPGPFTCRSIRIHTGGNNYQAHRLIVQSSDDGIKFTTVTRLEPPRHGWQDTDEDVTHSIVPTTARYFRFIYNKEGSEPGSEDLDAAKWKPSLKIMGLFLSDEPVINQYESKNGSMWRVSKYTTEEQVPVATAIPLKSIINLTGKMDASGKLNWNAPAGNWVIVRIGHTSTGHTNATGGGGKGLECDKFNAVAVKMQFDNWFGAAFKNTDSVLAKEVLQTMYVDSWECGSQNWSPVFAAEFKKRRGYDLQPYLLVMTGVPVENVNTAEKVLHDVRQTIAELVNDVFYVTLSKLTHEKGCSFVTEAIAPTMVSDGMAHYKYADAPMGEFWLNSPTHDKPNDMLDAISGGHIYGKKVIQAEAFTSIRMNWGEHPGNMKVVGDRNYALGLNKMVLHVFTLNPWMDRKPGMTLDGIGLYYQRDQTWFKQSKAWIDYMARCQALLQAGNPVVDIAVFTGEEVPRRAVLPDRLVSTLPGIFGKKKLEQEKERLANKGQPLRTIPNGVNHSANMADPEDWIDPLNGYAYDSFNPDALLSASVKNGRIVVPSGASYAILVVPGSHKMQPDLVISMAVAKKLLQFAKAGAKIIMSRDKVRGAGLKDKDDSVALILKQVFAIGTKTGNVVPAPYTDSSFKELGLQRDVDINNNNNSIAWTHRKTGEGDVYFISNQSDQWQSLDIYFRTMTKKVEFWNPVLGKTISYAVSPEKGRSRLKFNLVPNESVFVIFSDKIRTANEFKWGATWSAGINVSSKQFMDDWKLQFDPAYGGPQEPIVERRLKSWVDYPDPAIKYYSGTVVYSNTFYWSREDEGKSVWLEINDLYNIATVKVNGIDCGTIWTRPYSVDITKAVGQGENEVRIEVTNTWANRLIGDQFVPVEKKITRTTAPFRLRNKPLLTAGILGDIWLRVRSSD